MRMRMILKLLGPRCSDPIYVVEVLLEVGASLV